MTQLPKHYNLQAKIAGQRNISWRSLSSMPTSWQHGSTENLDKTSPCDQAGICVGLRLKKLKKIKIHKWLQVQELSVNSGFAFEATEQALSLV